MNERTAPGEVRDAIVDFLKQRSDGASVAEIRNAVALRIKAAAPSSVRSYLRLNEETKFHRPSRGIYSLRTEALSDTDHDVALTGSASMVQRKVIRYGKSELYQANCIDWLRAREERSIHAVVTDPPYGLVEYSETEQQKLRNGKGGVWRIPPSFDGHQRAPLPRFTTLDEKALSRLSAFYSEWAKILKPVLVPGAHVVIASNPLLSHRISWAIEQAGYERRGEIVRLVMTMRGGDRPKNAHREFSSVSVMPRSMWEPWLVFRKPLEGRVQDNLRKWKTGGFKRISESQPFGDVIRSHPTRREERSIAPHPSLKPQSFLRQIVRACLPLEQGIVLDPFAGSGSTLAAAEAVGYSSIGIELDPRYVKVAQAAIPKLSRLRREDDTPSLFATS